MQGNEKKTAIEIPVVKAQKQSYTYKMSDIGVVSARKVTTVYSPIRGYLTRLCKEGSYVKQGDFLAEFDKTDFAEEVRKQELTYQENMANIAIAQEELRKLKTSAQLEFENKASQLDFDKTELEVAQKSLQKQKRLFQEQIVTIQTVETEEANVRSREVTVKQSAIDFNTVKNTNDSDIIKKQAEINHLQTRARRVKRKLDDARSELSKTVILSPTSGIVAFKMNPDTDKKVQVGDYLNLRRGFIDIPDFSSFIIELPVREKDIGKIKVGDKAHMHVNAFPSILFTGKVEQIDTNIQETRWDKTVSSALGQKNAYITIGIDKNSKNLLQPGFTANIDIIENTSENAIVIPRECIFEEDKKYFVWVKREENFEKTFITTSIRNDDMATISSGIHEGDLIALRNPNLSLEEIRLQTDKDVETQKKQEESLGGAK